MQVIRQINDPCFFVDPVYGRCVMDGFAGARTDLSAIPSVDIANGAPTGVGATNEIVDAWADSGSNVNDNKALVSWSTDGGTTWSNPLRHRSPATGRSTRRPRSRPAAAGCISPTRPTRPRGGART